MDSKPDVVAVFTTRTVAQILAEGGLSGMTVDLSKVRRCRFLVCVRSSHSPDADFDHPSGSAFLVGRISGAMQLCLEEPQTLVTFNEVARVEVPFAWNGGTHPVFYTNFSDLGIAWPDLRFEDVQGLGERAFAVPPANEDSAEEEATRVRPLTIMQAKQGLAMMFGVDPDNVEITIKG
jgi:hypothetical protein